MTEEEYKTIGHSLGVKIDKYIGDKKLPKEFYRNHFQSEPNPSLLNLVKNKLMTSRSQFGQTVFHVTEKGKEEFKLEFLKRNK